jgi:hypothetical protein
LNRKHAESLQTDLWFIIQLEKPNAAANGVFIFYSCKSLHFRDIVPHGIQYYLFGTARETWTRTHELKIDAANPF